jgi:hypothetical protein
MNSLGSSAVDASATDAVRSTQYTDECADLDEAVEIASKHATVRDGVLELRPFWTG